MCVVSGAHILCVGVQQKAHSFNLRRVTRAPFEMQDASLARSAENPSSSRGASSEKLFMQMCVWVCVCARLNMCKYAAACMRSFFGLHYVPKLNTKHALYMLQCWRCVMCVQVCIGMLMCIWVYVCVYKRGAQTQRNNDVCGKQTSRKLEGEASCMWDVDDVIMNMHPAIPRKGWMPRAWASASQTGSWMGWKYVLVRFYSFKVKWV